MNIVTKISDWQALRSTLTNKTIGFACTMGHLHAGHMSLYDRSRRENELTVASIFVNPAQFNQKSDFDLYPRTVEQDIAMLEKHHVDILFLPDADEMYPDQYDVRVTEMTISKELEGEFRPGHFDGMLTVVLKLLNLVQPTHAYFGEKDYQQLLLIKKMAQALFLPVKIMGCETGRANDLLALSSRNSRLTPEQKKLAAKLPEIIAQDISADEAINKLVAAGFKVDYVCDKWDRRLAAVWLGDVRLIDNVGWAKAKGRAHQEQEAESCK